MKSLNRVVVQNFKSQKGVNFPAISLSYEVFGDPKNLQDRAVLVIHALTGNSQVAGDDGWWNHFIKEDGPLDLKNYTVICFNIPGNGFDKDDTRFPRHDLLSTRDIAALFKRGLEQINIRKLHAVIGGSLGGIITWELAIQAPDLATHYIPIGSFYESSDWVKAHCLVQEEIIKNSPTEEVGVSISRMLAMMFYRTPSSFKQRFKGEYSPKKGAYEVESYLNYQGKKLLDRMKTSSYRMMNYLLGSGDLTRDRGDVLLLLNRIKGRVTIIGISSDVLFPKEESQEAYDQLKLLGKDTELKILESSFGHDAFLLATTELADILAPIFPKKSSIIGNVIPIKSATIGGQL